MNKYLIIILIIFALIIIFNKKKNIKENMNNEKTCDYKNSLNINRGINDLTSESIQNEACYFKAIDDSDLEINTLLPIVGNNLSKKQINISDSDKKFFNYQNFGIVKPSLKNKDTSEIKRPGFNPDATVSRIPYLLHNDLFIRYYLTEINKSHFDKLNTRVDTFFDYIQNANVLKIDKLLYDNNNKINLIFSFDKTKKEEKKELKEEIGEEFKKIIPDFESNDSINNFINKVINNNMKLIILYQSNFLDNLLNKDNNYEELMDSVLFILTKDVRMINYIAKCINSSKIDELKKNASTNNLIMAKINSFNDSDSSISKNCNILGINKKRYKKDIRQILFNEIRNIYDNVYGLNEIPKLNISFNNKKSNKNYDKNMSGDLIRTKFNSLISGSAQGVTPVQTALSYFGLCDNIKKNNEDRKNKQININSNLKDKLNLPTVDNDNYNKPELSNQEKSKILTKNAEIRINQLDELISSLKNGLDESSIQLANKLNIDYMDENKIDRKIEENKQKIEKLEIKIKDNKEDISIEEEILNQLKQLNEKLENIKENPTSESLKGEIKELENKIYKDKNLEQTIKDQNIIQQYQIDKNIIQEYKNELKNSDFRKYYISLAVSDKIKNFSAKEIENRNNATYNTKKASYKNNFAKFNRYTKLDYFPEADLYESKKDDPIGTCLDNNLDTNEKPLLSSIFKCLIQKYTSIGISHNPYLAMDIAIENCEPNAGILFLDKNRYFSMPKIKNEINKVCTKYKPDTTFDKNCSTNSNCKIVKIVEINKNNNCKVHIGQGSNNLTGNKIVNNEYKKCLKSVEKSNKDVKEKCKNDFPESFPITVESNSIIIKKENINDYFNSIIVNLINNIEQTKSIDVKVIIGGINATLKANTLTNKLDEDDNVYANKITFTSESEIIEGESKLKIDTTDSELPIHASTYREEQEIKCISNNKYYCKLHSSNQNNIDLTLTDNEDNIIYEIDKDGVKTEKVKKISTIDGLGEAVKANCDKKYEKKYSTYKCLTDCHGTFSNKMKATGLGILKNTISSISGNNNNFINSDYKCNNVVVEDHTWETENHNFSKQPDVILQQFEQNGKVKIVNKFKKDCYNNAKNEAMVKCKNKLGDKNTCFFYTVDGKLDTGDNKYDPTKTIGDNTYDSLCKNTINSLKDVCQRDKNKNNPNICNEAIVIGVDKDKNKCYAFQSSNQCYIDYINGEQYDYFKINNIN